MFLGIEIGGTKLQLGVGRGDGALTGRWRGNVDVAAGPEGIRRQITGAVPHLLREAGVDRSLLKGIGIGFGGPVDDATHSVIKSHQIKGWDNFPLAEWVSGLVGLPAVLGNDADVAGLAEAHVGAGKGMSPVFYITVGSGIGGGLIVDGEIYRGVGRGAAEIGHLEICYDEELGRQVLEDVASGWGIAAETQRVLRTGTGRGSLLEQLAKGDESRITVPLIVEAALQGDTFARHRLRVACTHLAVGIYHVIALLCPRRIVVGGGVSLIGEELFFGPLRELVADRVFKPFAGLTDIVPAALGEEVVVHGALTLARRKLGKASS
jgi:glucokinase